MTSGELEPAASGGQLGVLSGGRNDDEFDLPTRLVGALGGTLLQLLSASIRWQLIELHPGVFSNAHSGEPRIYAMWHDRQLIAAPLFLHFWPRGRSIHVLISRSKDGRYVAALSKHVGMNNVAGSSSRGGALALRALERVLRARRDIAVTPDGPRGPRHEVKDGALILAERTGAPIVPFSCTVSRSWEFRSWDRMELAKPFCRGVLVVGEPWHPDPKDSLAMRRQFFAERLNVVTAHAFAAVGRKESVG